jgi:hypothetical protein
MLSSFCFFLICWGRVCGALKARRTLLHKLAAGGGHTGWSAAWAVAIAARLREPAAAHDALVIY